MPAPSIWTPEEEARVRELAGKVSVRRIADEVGKPPHVVMKYAKRAGIDLRSRTVDRYSPEEEARIRALTEQRLPGWKIAELMGRTETAISNWCRRHAVRIKSNDPTEWTDSMLDYLRLAVASGTPRRVVMAGLGLGRFAIEAKISELGLKMWTDERQALLVEKAAEGLSASQIADLLGVSRNSVIGRASRTGIKLKGTSRSVKKPLSPERKAARLESKRQCRQRYREMGLTSSGKPRVERAARPKPLPPAPKPILCEPVVPDDAPRGAGAAILALSKNGPVCHWPIGDPSSEDFTFCFAPRQPFGPQPYCDFHRGRSRNQASPPAGS